MGIARYIELCYDTALAFIYVTRKHMGLNSPESDMNPVSPESQLVTENFTVWAKKRALEHVSKESIKTEDLHAAIDSIVFDLGRDATRSPEDKTKIKQDGEELKKNPLLSKEEVMKFIQGFAE